MYDDLMGKARNGRLRAILKVQERNFKLLSGMGIHRHYLSGEAQALRQMPPDPMRNVFI